MKSFLLSEGGQGAIEYILLSGGIVLAGIFVFTIYSQMVINSALVLNESTDYASDAMADAINLAINNEMSKAPGGAAATESEVSGDSGDKGICGPTFVLLTALLPKLLRSKKRYLNNTMNNSCRP